MRLECALSPALRREDSSEVYQTYSYGTLLWPRLFNDDIPLGGRSFLEGLINDQGFVSNYPLVN